jgi:hypothetical protein
VLNKEYERIAALPKAMFPFVRSLTLVLGNRFVLTNVTVATKD